ncbi:MAG: thioesterase family protein [Pseudohongiellaceae bacterium]|nr:thioesterase family protein [Pseudohongiellaceae bacterium]
MNNKNSELTLEKALTLKPVDTGLWQTTASKDYEANTGMFGGLTAALLLKAITDDTRSSGSPSSITVNYVNRIEPGSQLTIHVQPMGGGRSITHWRSEIYNEDQSELKAYATVILAKRRESTQHNEWTMPQVPAPKADTRFAPPGTFGQQMRISPVAGFPPFGQENTQSISWIKERSGRDIDAIQLCYLSDVYPPRIWYIGKEPRPSATLTLSVYFHATPEQMARIGDDYVLSEVTGTRAEHATMGSQARLWSSAGELLATTEQLCWFK